MPSSKHKHFQLKKAREFNTFILIRIALGKKIVVCRIVQYRAPQMCPK